MDEIIALLKEINSKIQINDNEWIKTIITMFVGTVFGVVINEIVQGIGKIRVECISVDQSYYSKDNKKIKRFENPYKAICCTNLLIHNSSKNLKIMKNVNIDVYCENKKINSSYIYDKVIGQNQIKVFNINEHSIVDKKIYFQISETDLKIMYRKNDGLKLYFSYETERYFCRKRKVKLFQIYI